MELVPFDKRSGKIWLNNQMINWSDAKIHIFKGGDLEEEYKALKKNRPDARLNQTLLDFDEFPFFSENQKYLITLTFPSI